MDSTTKKQTGRIPINKELFHLIKKSIGREKLDGNETHREVPGKIDRWHKRRSK